MKVDLAGRVALITGSGQGIGQAMAYAFSENGAVIAVNDIKPTGDGTVAEIQKRGGKAKFYQGDVGDVDVVNAMVAAVEDGPWAHRYSGEQCGNQPGEGAPPHP